MEEAHMKKWGGCLVATAMLFSVGCQTTSYGSMIQTDFRLTAEMEQNSSKFQADVERMGGNISVCYSAPSSMEGITYTFHEDSVSISYQGLEDTSENPAITSTSNAGMIAEAIEDAIPKSGASKIEGTITAGTYCMEVDTDAGLPTSLSIPEKHFTCTFRPK